MHNTREFELTILDRYKHGVIQNLFDDALLRKVRKEILDNLHFTPKETDIYRIHQSGDLANLDGLDDESLERLPSLVELRNALYSSTFRKYLSQIAGAGPLSGTKTDMAINVYTPGCHLLCHDDVIGSRRLSYILYLTDPEHPWKAEWGGALRLYPTQNVKSADGSDATIPSPEFSVVIPPAFNQLSFFTIQPGRSFHDVEEVYDREKSDDDDDGGRMRMAISGWFHIPQEGEEGYEEGLEEELTERSSLNQLQSKANESDLPQPIWREVKIPEEIAEGLDFNDAEFEWLLQFIRPAYLTPETVEQLSENFEENSAISLEEFLQPKFAKALKALLLHYETKIDGLMPILTGLDQDSGVARPPHKHRFLYCQPGLSRNAETPSVSLFDKLLGNFLTSDLFARWLSVVSGLKLSRSNTCARRFRRGSDYILATSYDDETPQLEVTLGLTPTPGWAEEADESESEEDSVPSIPPKNDSSGHAQRKRKDENLQDAPMMEKNSGNQDNVGGYDVYMAGDDDEDEDQDGGGSAAEAAQGPSNTGAGQRRKAKSDPAIYKTNTADEDGGVLFSMPANWNNLSIVLRDQGVLRFVKYVSKRAQGDRWDVVANFSVVPEDDDEDDDDENDGEDDE